MRYDRFWCGTHAPFISGSATAPDDEKFSIDNEAKMW